MNALPILLAAALAAVALAGCAPQPAPVDQTAAPETTAATPAAPADFVNRVWRVSASPSVAVGSMYVFLAESTLVMTGPGSTPAFGSWRREGDGLVMVEDGIAYPTDIVSLTVDEFVIKSHNPGGAVDITLVPAEAR